MTPFPELPKGPWASRGVTRHEKQMLQFVADVLDQPGGRELLLTEDGIQALRGQFGLDDAEVIYGPEITQRYLEMLFRAALRDLKRKTIQSACAGVCAVLDAEFEVLRSDALVPEALQQSLGRLAGQQAEAGGAAWDVRCFLTDDADDREWWGSRSVLDPFLFPAVRGRTKTLEEGGRIDLERCWQWMGMGDVQTTDGLLGTYGKDKTPLEFQVLPSEVHFRPDGTAQIASYVNGLHPSVGGMYGALEKMLDVVIPQWQRVLGSFEDCRRIVLGEAFMEVYMSELLYREFNEKQMYQKIEVLNQEKREDFKPARMGEEDRLQVIFRMDNIAGEAAYTQDGGKLEHGDNYSRGEWRRAAPFSEDVVAVAIYCYEADESPGSEVRIQLKQNTSPDVLAGIDAHLNSGNGKFLDTTSKISGSVFSKLYDEGEVSPYNDVARDYPGMDPEKPRAAELLGSVRLAKGRLLVFPASVQHRFWVKGVPASCGILTMALVDPRRPSRLSTATVPPQSRDYWRAHIRDIPWFRRLPEELWLLINSELDSIRGGAADGYDDDEEEESDGSQQYPVSRRAARETRQKVNEARARYEQEITKTMPSSLPAKTRTRQSWFS
ncbi:unnamed protein product [Clonostachys rosea]|uniref:DUF4246 domain-containing protein n=1 Tax=Bionectria ochroleuca TaxID=29856 RepID=A0ABY6UMD7_BIOOC|nr:unnamed protein product [Clonostachys rosea]